MPKPRRGVALRRRHHNLGVVFTISRKVPIQRLLSAIGPLPARGLSLQLAPCLEVARREGAAGARRITNVESRRCEGSRQGRSSSESGSELSAFSTCGRLSVTCRRERSRRKTPGFVLEENAAICASPYSVPRAGAKPRGLFMSRQKRRSYTRFARLWGGGGGSAGGLVGGGGGVVWGGGGAEQDDGRDRHEFQARHRCNHLEMIEHDLVAPPPI